MSSEHYQEELVERNEKLIEQLYSEFRDMMKRFKDQSIVFRSLDRDGQLNIVEKASKWLEREIKTLLASNTTMSHRVLMTIFDDLSGDLTLKAFQLQTLEKLTSRYLNDYGFQWFINSTFTSMSNNVEFNTVLLEGTPFSDYRPLLLPDSSVLSLTDLSEKERMLQSTVETSMSGHIYLMRRPWLAMYILAIRQYKQINSLEWLIKEIRAIETEPEETDPLRDPKGPLPDPDSISTDIPYPEWAVPPLNNLGA